MRGNQGSTLRGRAVRQTIPIRQFAIIALPPAGANKSILSIPCWHTIVK
jgi:hypothetical protein